MKDYISLRNTKCYNNGLKQVPQKHNIYKVQTLDKNAIRRFKEGRNNAIMLAGGPKLVEGQLLPNTEEKYRIVQISYLQGNYYIVLKEESNETIKYIPSNKSNNLV